MDRSSLIDIVKRNEPITEEAPNTSTDRSTRHSPGRTLRGYCTFAPARDRPRASHVVLTRPFFADLDSRSANSGLEATIISGPSSLFSRCQSVSA